MHIAEVQNKQSEYFKTHADSQQKTNQVKSTKKKKKTNSQDLECLNYRVESIYVLLIISYYMNGMNITVFLCKRKKKTNCKIMETETEGCRTHTH